MPESTDGFLHRVGLRGRPQADPAAIVVVGNARFTVLTDRLIRLEWAGDGRFEDRSSFAFPSRRGPVPAFTVTADEPSTVLDTGALRLRHTPDGQPFSEENLDIEVRALPGTRWTPGLRDRRNLGGARRTVDGCRGEAGLEAGLASRSGWALHDDAASLLFDEDGWVTPRNPGSETLDWYFFGHGHDYPAAVRDYLAFAGGVPLVPRWMLGAWWSRYWAYRDEELRALVEEFSNRRLPLDVLVIDMDWHLPDSWTGYTWNRELFPDPAGFLGWLHERGLHSTLNLHPALGVQPFEEAYGGFAEAMGLAGGTDAVPFHIDDPAFVRSYFQLLHHPLEDQGVDFWWMDWQQGRAFGPAGIDPLPWLNHLHFTDLGRDRRHRPITFSRWGGLGSHRYPIGFSGDSFAQWEALRFQPRYTAAGANVGYGWWSHDIGGHVGPDDPELYVRWVQFGAMSPILRLHSNQDPRSERRPWMFGEAALEAAQEAFAQRYQLIPYLYTAARTATDTGMAPVRPLSWLAPEDDNAYAARYEYQLGDALVVAPVLHPADPVTGLADVDVWLPAGEWIERTTLETVTGPCWVRQLADLHRIPQFVRAGTVLPLAEVAANTTAQSFDFLVLAVYPGADSTARVYSDDGVSAAYGRGEFGWTEFGLTAPDASTLRLTITPAEDGASEHITPRRLAVRFEGTREPRSVTVDGVAVDWHRDGLATVLELATVLAPTTVPAGPVRIELVTDGPVSALGPDRNGELRQREVRQLLDERLPADADQNTLLRAVQSLPGNSAARASAIARLGGPALRVDEQRAPDEAADTLGRLVVGLGASQRAELTGTWTLERGSKVHTHRFGPELVTGAGRSFSAPFRWDDSLTPTRWRLAVQARWASPVGEITVDREFESATLWPALPSWAVAVTEPSVVEPSVRDWTLTVADPFDPDFAELGQRFEVPLQHSPLAALDGPAVVHARTRLTVASDREVDFRYFSSDEIEIFLDGVAVQADVTGGSPSRHYDLAPVPRRTATVRLTAGAHELRCRSVKSAELPWHQWSLSVSVTEPGSDRVVLDVLADASPFLARFG